MGRIGVVIAAPIYHARAAMPPKRTGPARTGPEFFRERERMAPGEDGPIHAGDPSGACLKRG